MEVIIFLVVIRKYLRKVLLGHLQGWIRLEKMLGSSNVECLRKCGGIKGFSRICSEVGVQPE